MAQVKHTLVPLMRPRKSGSAIPPIFLPLKYFPHIASGIWGSRNRVVTCWVKTIPIRCGRTSHPMHAYLITGGGTHESIPLEEVVHPTCNRRRVLGDIVISSNALFYVEQKLGSYYSVSGPYLSHLVSTHDECVKFESQRPLTIFMLATDGSIFPALDMFSRALSQTRWTSDINTEGAGRGFTNRVYHRIRVLARTIIPASAPVAIFSRELVSG